MKILVISDTHIPRLAQDLPQQIYDAIGGVDMIFHAGDFVEKELYCRLAAMKETKAVAGNMDGSDLRAILPQKEIIEIGKVRIGITHGHGAQRELINSVAREFSNIDAIVFGHSHSATNVVKDGILYFNPGSPTDNIFAPAKTYGILTVTDDKIAGDIIKI